MNQKINWLFFLLFIAYFGHAQTSTKAPKNWFHLDPTEDDFPGISADNAHTLLKGNKGEKVVVAIIDSGVDYKHEDLKDVMWVNKDEKPDNGVDDDNNGYVDDIHGWNFIVNDKGENVANDSYEVTRLFVKLKKKYDGKKPDDLSKKDKEEYEKFKKYEEVVNEKRADAEENLMLYGTLYKGIEELVEILGKKPEEITEKDIENFETENEFLERVVLVISNVMAQGNEFSAVYTDLKDLYQYYADKLNYHYNTEFSPRTEISEGTKFYGNNDVRGPDAEHGTHVAGIVAATRNNDLGMNGVANNVQIMAIRAVPNGDERDLDIANAIRYAVDNGASIINMSFGKGASPQKNEVDKAVKYAMKKDVLIVHAAGNENEENFAGTHFPNDKFMKKGLFQPKYAKNWIEVGALDLDGNPAGFSNFSPNNVDVFAPGVQIYATVPDDEYKNLQGTSMASPVVAGAAAVLRSHFPDLTAKQVKDIIMLSVNKKKEKVNKPGGEGKQVYFKELSVTGGSINLNSAIALASKTKGKKKGKKRVIPVGTDLMKGKENNAKKKTVVP